MKAIETLYKGYRFRSRLEARWAVFFDHLGIEWIYEREGYELPSGRYLPDFWLPQVQMFAEVKPSQFSESEFRICSELAAQSGFAVLMLDDSIPDDAGYWAIEPNGELIDCWPANGDYPVSEGRFYSGYSGMTWPEKERDADIKGAAAAARSARFEHGENGGSSR